MKQHVTLLRPDPGKSQAQESVPRLPTDLLSQAAGRLRALALLYAFVFFMAGIFPMLVIPDDRAQLFGSFLQWGPGGIVFEVWRYEKLLQAGPGADRH
ncbi:MAG: hypothetical protein M3Q93_08360 [Gemmatimonadota bacterium]|nr:hypothetical protein [Gemmatimonadota bacterium]